MEPEVLALKQRMAANTVRGVFMAGQHLLGQAVERAPVEEGTLRASAELVLIVNGARFAGAGMLLEAQAAARAIVAVGRRLAVDAEVSFNTVYAARQHEETTWRHPKGGQAKFLSEPLNSNLARYHRVITAAAEHTGAL